MLAPTPTPLSRRLWVSRFARHDIITIHSAFVFCSFFTVTMYAKMHNCWPSLALFWSVAGVPCIFSAPKLHPSPAIKRSLNFPPISADFGVHRPFNVALITSAPAALPHDNQSPGTPSTLLSHATVAETSWENLREGRRSDCAFRRDFNDNVANVAMFAANNNTSRLLEGKEKIQQFWLHAHARAHKRTYR